VLGNTAAAVAPRWLSSVWFTTESYVRKNPDVTKRLIGALRAGSLWGNTHRDESTDILVKYTKMQRDLALKLDRDTLGTDVTPQLIQPTLDILARYSAMPNPVTAAQLIWNPR
jgi:ABC-type nitrate/sulfonate/bicarbonate transport system substrate-binding protein